ncbi:MAG: 16S rRNA (guanine(966)-N(2))-methyltransferase RsmD [Chloroflexi bacterium]|nr:16S rRNA (guanine(966)-N(2))-methyltransferase RsmD [Chloroflexota bacterium]MBU1751046.1 16S rRNA (guanine(966)-N(2))-methyltransferase RsmD [Chloroflexota bacterium]MBU1877734.1 16S rRNA (guanine(966)-N(2))-methyltransferase RsmD [Chloroflexota bacterium]
MRVIAGEAKGRNLYPVPGQGTRPIADRVKAALFDTLGARVLDCAFLDLFAGTGSVAIEALSRGADHAVLVEQSHKAIATIHRNLQETGLRDRAWVERADVFRFLRAVDESFDIVYVAPPQYQGLWAKTVRLIDEHPGILTADGLVIAQIHPKEYEDLALTALALTDKRRYGSTELCFYEPGATPDGH